MTKTQLEERMRMFGRGTPATDEMVFSYVMNSACEGYPEKAKVERVLDTLLMCARSRMDNLRGMSDGYKGTLRKDFNSNMYTLMGILTSSQPIRKKLIVGIALMNSYYERLND